VPTPSARLRQAARDLERVAGLVDSGQAERECLDSVSAELARAAHELFGPRPRAAKGQGGRQKILRYLLAHVGEDVSGDELYAVSGIHEWARRLRELRVEQGYEIREVGDSVYRLEESEPNLKTAELWKLLNGIRRRKGGARDRIAALFEARVGEVVSREQLDYVGRIAEGVRRQRELRDEFGWPIASHIDDPGLRPGEYRLLSADAADRRDPLQRLYPEAVRQRVFERDSYTCEACGRDRAAALAAGDNRFYLEVHHRVAVADELADLPRAERNDLANLVTLCHRDHLRETAELQSRKRSTRQES
jgi:hypothetical protein